MTRVWEEARWSEEQRWDRILEEAVGRPVAEIWGDFTADVGNGELEDSALYAEVAHAPLVLDSEGSLPYLGSHYFDVEEEGLSLLSVSAAGVSALSSLIIDALASSPL